MTASGRAVAAGLLAALGASASGAALQPGVAKGANLLVVTLDTTRPDRLGAYGDQRAETPSFDALAARSLQYTEAVTVAPVTLVAHSSLFTGTYPTTHGVRHNAEYKLNPEAHTLAELLARAGYETAAFVSAFVLDARYGLDQGFSRYDDRVDTARGAGFPAGTNERNAQKVTDAALAWLTEREATSARRPFFAWVHYFDAHAPYLPPEPFATRFAGRLYDGELAFVDSQLGRLLAAFHERGLAERTVVLVVGDHGESLGEHGESTHSVFVYDATARVPFVLHVPGVAPAVVSDRLVSLVDALPTLVDLLGVKDATPREGVSLASARRDGSRSVYLESLVPYVDFGWAPLHALRRLGEKYIAAPRSEYYDLTKDPTEARNLVPAKGPQPAGAERLARSVQALLEKSQPLASSAAAPDADARARVEALGYLGGAGPVAGTPGALPDPKDMIQVSEAIVEANGRLASGKAAAAIALLEPQLKVSPRDRSVLQALAKAYLRTNRLADAERVLRAFREIRPKADTSLLLAQILILDGRFDEAARILDEAERLDAKHGGVLIARGDLLARQGRTGEARAAYERARQIDPYRAAGMAGARLAALKPVPSPAAPTP